MCRDLSREKKKTRCWKGREKLYKQRALSVQLGSFFVEYSQRTSQNEKKKKKCVNVSSDVGKSTTKQKLETAVIMSRRVFNLWLGHFRHERQMSILSSNKINETNISIFLAIHTIWLNTINNKLYLIWILIFERKKICFKYSKTDQIPTEWN